MRRLALVAAAAFAVTTAIAPATSATAVSVPLQQTGTPGNATVTAYGEKVAYLITFCVTDVAECTGENWTYVTFGEFGPSQEVVVSEGTIMGVKPDGTSPLPAGCYNVSLFVGDDAVLTSTLANAAIGAASCGAGDPGAQVAPPPPWLQSYGRTRAGDCRPGWHASWAEWAIEKTGGWVCNRTVYWSGSAWVQNPDAVWGASNPSETTRWDGS